MKTFKRIWLNLLIGSAVFLLTPVALAASDGLRDESAGPGPVEMQEIMQAHVTGGQLYRKKKYLEAIEHLEIAAKGGQKRSQAQLGAIYLYGLGDLPQNTKKGVGWLGVAAEGETEPAYRKTWREVYQAISPAQRSQIDQLVDAYVDNYGPEATKVTCKQERRAGTRMSRLICTFDDLHKYRDQMSAETYSALSTDGQITDYAENYASGGFGGGGGGIGGGGGGSPTGGGGSGGGGGFIGQ